MKNRKRYPKNPTFPLNEILKYRTVHRHKIKYFSSSNQTRKKEEIAIQRNIFFRLFLFLSVEDSDVF
jgi:hypothetical protein